MRCLLLLLISMRLCAQVKAPDSVFCDCGTARPVTIRGAVRTPATVAPPGAGVRQEISPAKQKTAAAFEKEHHSAWYKLIIQTNGGLTFDIIPHKADDDYDFMLFKSSGKNFCDSMVSHRITPVRACISRDKDELKGKTGLKQGAIPELVKPGLGESYCRPVIVSKGEVYYLVLDNVYDKGDGHCIQFYIF